MKEALFSELKGKTLVSVDGRKGDGSITFKTKEGDTYCQNHHQDCCEQVWVEDICGEWEDILNEPILMAEANEEASRGGTWTFYRLATNKGSVVIRWLGQSNGYYSESVSFEKL